MSSARTCFVLFPPREVHLGNRARTSGRASDSPRHCADQSQNDPSMASRRRHTITFLGWRDVSKTIGRIAGRSVSSVCQPGEISDFPWSLDDLGGGEMLWSASWLVNVDSKSVIEPCVLLRHHFAAVNLTLAIAKLPVGISSPACDVFFLGCWLADANA